MKVSKSAYYASLNRLPSKRRHKDDELKVDIQLIHKQSRNTYGKRRLQAELRSNGQFHGLPRIARLMKESGIKAKAAKKHKVTTDSKHNLVVYTNELKRHFSPEKPRTHFVSDITYIRTLTGWLYLAVTLDLFSRKVVGWSMANHMRAELVCNALLMAKAKSPDMAGCIHHSDRGVQYCSDAFQTLLKSNGVIPSMSRKGNCWDNAVAESFFHSLKTECIENKIYANQEEAKHEIFDYIEVFYNKRRRHSFLGYTSPLEFEKMSLAA